MLYQVLPIPVLTRNEQNFREKTEPSGSSVEACGNQHEPTGKNGTDCLVPSIIVSFPPAKNGITPVRIAQTRGENWTYNTTSVPVSTKLLNFPIILTPKYD